MASNVAIIYSQSQKVIRRIIVSDTDRELNAALQGAVVPGEGLMFLPKEEYNTLNAITLRQRVAQEIGVASSDRVVEVDQGNRVVAVFHGDPTIDKPLRNKNNTLEIHKDATIGDVKVGTDFPAKAPMEPSTPQELAATSQIINP